MKKSPSLKNAGQVNLEDILFILLGVYSVTSWYAIWIAGLEF